MDPNKSSVSEDVNQFEKRKKEHIEHALDPYSQADADHCFSKIDFIHNALPEINFSEIQIEDKNKASLFSSPFFVASMTAGHEDGKKINYHLAEACSKTSWAMGVGSQRRELFDSSERHKWDQIRKDFPEIKMLSNVGLSQAILSSVTEIESLVDSIQASALMIHTNPLQEALQEEGTPLFKGGLKAIERLCAKIKVPVILKETGCGFSKANFESLNGLGLYAVDVSGKGGTHWGRIEGMRAKDKSLYNNMAVTFKDWGITSVDSLKSAQDLNLDYQIWASGGIRNGLDAAKSIALGAKKVSYAKQVLAPALKSSEAVIAKMKEIEHELKIAMFCTGQKSFDTLCGNISLFSPKENK